MGLLWNFTVAELSLGENIGYSSLWSWLYLLPASPEWWQGQGRYFIYFLSLGLYFFNIKDTIERKEKISHKSKASYWNMHLQTKISNHINIIKERQPPSYGHKGRTLMADVMGSGSAYFTIIQQVAWWIISFYWDFYSIMYKIELTIWPTQ